MRAWPVLLTLIVAIAGVLPTHHDTTSRHQATPHDTSRHHTTNERQIADNRDDTRQSADKLEGIVDTRQSSAIDRDNTRQIAEKLEVEREIAEEFVDTRQISAIDPDNTRQIAEKLEDAREIAEEFVDTRQTTTRVDDTRQSEMSKQEASPAESSEESGTDLTIEKSQTSEVLSKSRTKDETEEQIASKEPAKSSNTQMEITIDLSQSSAKHLEKDLPKSSTQDETTINMKSSKDTTNDISFDESQSSPESTEEVRQKSRTIQSTSEESDVPKPSSTSSKAHVPKQSASSEVPAKPSTSSKPDISASQRLLQEQAGINTDQPDKKQVVQQLERSLLSLFGMKRRPSRNSGPVYIPPAMRRLYEEANRLRNDRSDRSDSGDSTDSSDLGEEVAVGGGLGARKGLHAGTANTVRSFTHTESPIDNRFTSKHRFRLSFNVSSIPSAETLKAAELTLHHTPSGKNQRVLVYDLIRPGIKGKQEPILRLIDTKVLTAKTGDQVNLDVYPAVERWIQEPAANHGLLVHVASKQEHGLRLRRDTEEDEYQPTLLTYTDDGRGAGNSNLRHKRAASQRRAHRRKNSHDVCQRRPLYVDFSDVGWTDWIVAPPGYDAYYCYGDCPFPLAEHLNSTNHAIVQNLVNGVNPSAVPKACCVPTQLSSISMLYLDEDKKVVLKNYQDMAVVGCGCR